MTVWVTGGIVLLTALWLILAYNRLIRSRNLVREAWSGIDVQLKRRHDLVPNLVETAKGYSRFERSLLENITRARSEAVAAQMVTKKAEAENVLTGNLRRLFAVAEAYPDLKANQQYLALQKNLVEVEDQIQLSRRYYNGAVREYNIRAESFPSLLAARLFGFSQADYFEIELSMQRETPKVNSKP